MDNEIVTMIKTLIDKFSSEQKRLEQKIIKGTIKESVSNDELLALAKDLISNTTKIKRIILMLEDIKSMMNI
jgi:hypothetical protein